MFVRGAFVSLRVGCALTLAAPLGCSSSPSGSDAGAGKDAGSGIPDGGAVDGGSPDAGGSDAGGQDAGQPGMDAGVDAGCGCDAGVCVGDGGCGACLQDSDCADAGAPRCDPATNACVACLPGATDNCPAQQYCDPGALQCAQGCKTGASCASGACDATHNCIGCAGDGECNAQNVCQQGLCGPPCSAPADCATGLTCCAPHCLNTTTDIDACGGCGNACGSTQFCDGTACEAVQFYDFCAAPQVSVIVDGESLDVDAGGVIATAIVSATGCVPPPQVAFVSTAADSGVIDPATGRPIAGGGQILVAAGGPFVDPVVTYLEVSASPVYFASTATDDQFLLRDGGVVVDVPSASLSPQNDYFLLELVREPVNGTLTFVCYGMVGWGTPAGARYFANVMLPQIASTSGTWLVAQWTSPDGGDNYSIVAQGP